jgi:Eukaryotic aspartyl protease
MRKWLLNAGLAVVMAGLLYSCWILLEHLFSHAPLTDQVILGDGWLSVPLLESESAPMISAGFGSSQKSVAVLLDTGSDNFWVRRNHVHDSDTLNITDDEFTVVYAGGSVKGINGMDTVQIGNLTWRQPLGLVHQSTTELTDISSILGLSRKCRKECTLSHLRLKQPQVSFLFDLRTRRGSFLAGVLNSSLCIEDQEIHWVPLLPNHFFWRTHCSMYLGAHAIANELVAIWDTGTTYTFLRNSLYHDLMSKLPGVSENCIFTDLPVITLKLAGKIYSFTPEVYAHRTSNNTCEFRFAKLEDTWGSKIEADLIIGWTMIRSHYVVFDMHKDAIGLCQSQSLDFVNSRRTLF